MRLLTQKILFIIFCLLSTSTGYSIETPNLNNLLVYKETKELKTEVIFVDFNGDKVKLSDYKNKLIILNFWATWCAPCKIEMPSLDNLQINKNFLNLKIFPINIEQKEAKKYLEFFKQLNIKNLEIYMDPSNNLPNEFLLRGIPTSIFIDKNGKEFARVLGFIDFENDEFIDWLKNYD